MPQQINVTVPIPDNFILISTEEYDELQEQTLQGRAWGMKELRGWLDNKSPEWIKDNILFDRRFKDEIERMERQRLIIRPVGRGGSWKFKADEMTKFLDKHWTEFNW